jgi:Secretion system C-terminal sorting domain
MNRYLLLVCNLFLCNLLIAQVNDALRDRIWPFGKQCAAGNIRFTTKHLDFNTSPPTLYERCPNIERYDFTRASICDTLGNIILTTNGCTLEDGHGGVIVPAFNVDNQSAQCPYGRRTPQGALILPRPGHVDEYVLFNGAVINHTIIPTNPRYVESGSMIQMSINVVRKNSTGTSWTLPVMNRLICTDTLSAGKIVACRHANGRDWWIIVPKMYSNRYHKFLLTAHPQTAQGQGTGVDDMGYQEIGNSLYDPGYGQSCFSPDGRYYARVESKYNFGWGYPGQEVVLMDFDRCTGMFSNQRYWRDDLVCAAGGVAFSENSRYLYASKDSFVRQMDLQTIPLVFDTVAIYNGLGDTTPSGIIFPRFFSVLQLAPDGKIYGGSSSQRYIHVIENPNVGGMGCNAINGGLNLGIVNSFGVPHYPYFRLGREVGSGCDTIYSAVAEVDVGGGIKIYPNPAQTTFTIEVQDSGGMIEVYDLLGRQICHSNIIGNQQVIDVAEYSKGLYLVKYSDSKGKAWCRKVVIN